MASGSNGLWLVNPIHHILRGTGDWSLMPAIAAHSVLYPFKSWHSGTIENKLAIGRKKLPMIIELWSSIRLFERERVLRKKIGLFHCVAEIGKIMQARAGLDRCTNMLARK